MCEIAFQSLSHKAAAKVTELIDSAPGCDTFADSCLYADDRRRDGRYRSNEHYVNLSRDDEAFVDDPCPEVSKCVVNATMAEVRTLAIANQASEQLEALKFLGHWVGDVHQPLHVSFKDDKGANDIGNNRTLTRLFLRRKKVASIGQVN